MERLLKLPPFAIFCIIGLINTAIDVAIFLTLQGQGLPIIAANIASTSVALVVSFILNKRFTFDSQAPTRQTLLPFIAVTLTGLWLLQPLVIYLSLAFFDITAVNNLATAIYADFNSIQNLLAKLVATPATIIWNFVLYKRFVFKPQTRPQTI